MTSAHRPARHVLIAAVAVVTALSGCVESNRPADTASGNTECPFEADPSVTSTARIAYQNIPNGDLVVKDQRMLENCMPNAKITWNKFDSGGDVIQAFGSNSADMGLIGSSPATKALSAPLNIPMRVVWVHDVIGKAESLAVRDPAITDIKQLKGKTIAVAFSSTAHYSLLQALQDAGMNAATDVSIVNLSPDKMPSAWEGGQIDGAWVWDPTLSELLKSNGHILISSAETAKAGKPTYDLGAATTSFIDANPEFMTVWAKAQNAAVEEILNKPDDASVSIGAVMGIQPDEVKKQFDGYEYLPAKEQASADYLGGKLATDLQETAGFLLKQGGITAVSPPAAYAAGVDAKPAEAAAK
ncbi:glycine/betaine ABC transporter substrate-binding protein [Mycolicibacterium moriokaense]|nr:glycine/betaine ABC transporter substrate-binding protein [Mycolicibacterium moriokaense]